MSALIANPAVRSLLRGILVWAPLWIGTTLLFGGLGVCYVLFLKEDTYLASQALLVRDEATGAVMRLGRFQSQAEMKAAQETILEMAKSQQVVRDALLMVGKPDGLSGWLSWGEYPSKELVEEVAKSGVSVHAPKGTEFGVTEVIYLDVKADDKDDASSLSKAFFEALEARLQQVRKARADGVIAELSNARDSAKREVVESTAKLRDMENSAGSDLSDLRGMTDMIAGGATSRAQFDQIKNEIRQAEITRQALIADREMLVRAVQDPTSFIVAPGTVLSSQPGLKRLREGLVDAQISGSQLAGKFTDNHPLVNASQNAQTTIVKRFTQELKASIASVESDIQLADGKIQRLVAEQVSAEERLSTLADGRSTYANMLSEVKSKLSILESAERELAEARAARDSSVSTSLITRLDAPIVSDRPIGPGRTTIAGLCTIAGLVFGLGVVFVVTPIDASPTFGRRSADRYRSRRGIDSMMHTEDAAPQGSTEIKPDKQTTEMPNESQLAVPKEKPTTDSEVGTFQHTKLNMQSSTVSPAQVLANSIAELSSDLEMPDAYQPLIKPKPPKVIAELSPAPVVPSETEVDKAFQELSRLQSQKPENRSEELSVQMKVQELKLFLLNQGAKPGDVHARSSADEPVKQKPRSTKH
jgi:succinoglycan biosynthesis transport protein ExoP